MLHDSETPPASELGFDSSEALEAHSAELAVDGIAGRRRLVRPGIADQFVAIVRGSPCGSGVGSDYSDARYYLDRAVPKYRSSAEDALSAQADNVPGIMQCLTATNLAELSIGSHLLAAGTIVRVAALYTRSGTKLYVFNQPPPGGVVVEITGTAGTGGKYTGTIVVGPSTATSSGTVAMPEGMVVPAGGAALILNLEEDGQSGHRLKVPCYAVGQIVGISAGAAIVMIRGALGATSGATALSGSGLSPDTGSWSRAMDGTPVTVSVQTRTVWDSTGGTLYAYLRSLSFDARGLLIAVSSESQATIDTATACG